MAAAAAAAAAAATGLAWPLLEKKLIFFAILTFAKFAGFLHVFLTFWDFFGRLAVGLDINRDRHKFRDTVNCLSS